MRVLLDTNILLRMTERSHVMHSLASQSVQALRDAGHELYIVPQNIYEFWNVATRTLTKNGLELPVSEAKAFVDHFTGIFPLLRDERFIYEVWIELVMQHQLRGHRHFDARLAAALVRHRISHILTFNGDDFRRFSKIEVLDPMSFATR
jgi:predicted nucleic acid-binding protein